MLTQQYWDICYLSPAIFDWLYWKGALNEGFFSDFLLYHYSDFWYYSSLLNYGNFLKKYGKNKNKLRTIYSKNHENFKNIKPRVQFYWFELQYIINYQTCVWIFTDYRKQFIIHICMDLFSIKLISKLFFFKKVWTNNNNNIQGRRSLNWRTTGQFYDSGNSPKI